MFVTGEVSIKGLLSGYARLFQFDHHPRQSIHETYQIRTAGVELADNGHLTYQQEIVGGRVIPVYDLHPLNLQTTPRQIRHGHFHPVAHQRPKFTICSRWQHC